MKLVDWEPEFGSAAYVPSELLAGTRNGRNMLAADSGWYSVGGVPHRVVFVDPHAAGNLRARGAAWKRVATRAAKAVQRYMSDGDARPSRVKATVYLWRGKKRLPRRSCTISQDNANSGVSFTDTATGCSEILVFREEESVKTLIHEMLHAHRLGEWANAAADAMGACELLGRSLGVRVDSSVAIRPAEAIVDAFAIRIACEAFGGRAWEDCVRHAESLSARLVRRCVLEHGGAWRQSTHAFEYFCVKPVLMRSIDRLVQAHAAGLQSPRRDVVVDIIREASAVAIRAAGTPAPRSAVRMRMTPFGLAAPP